MTEQKAPRKKTLDYKKLIVLILALTIVCVGTVFLGQYVIKKIDGYSPEQQQEITDELMRARHFASDWFDEISELGYECDTYLNELRFKQSSYTITFAGQRFRAVFPRGERYFQFEYVRRVEFFKVGAKIRCRFYYGNSDEYTFALGKN